jgi:hypothetical protein
LLPRGWTFPALAAELRRAETERQAQQPDMDSNQYYAEWLLVRVERGETSWGISLYVALDAHLR